MTTTRRTESDRYAGASAAALEEEADLHFSVTIDRHFWMIIDNSYGLPRPRLNADLSAGGRFFNVDCLWRDARLIVELDGRAVHATRRAFESDRERDRVLMGDGWRVMRITWRQLHEQKSSIAADLRKALAHA